MPSVLKLALYLTALTLIVPLLVWAQSTSWRVAWSAWKGYAAWMGGLYAIGLLVWLGMGAPL